MKTRSRSQLKAMLRTQYRINEELIQRYDARYKHYVETYSKPLRAELDRLTDKVVELMEKLEECKRNPGAQ